MKLRNKKTGEVVESIQPLLGGKGYTLRELNEKWEDYEEPKYVWYVTSDGRICKADYVNAWDGEKSIGNYFETREAAEKAVERLKTWKRLRGKGIKEIVSYRINDTCSDGLKVGLIFHAKDEETVNDIKLLFGGEK